MVVRTGRPRLQRKVAEVRETRPCGYRRSGRGRRIRRVVPDIGEELYAFRPQILRFEEQVLCEQSLSAEVPLLVIGRAEGDVVSLEAWGAQQWVAQNGRDRRGRGRRIGCADPFEEWRSLALQRHRIERGRVVVNAVP